MNTINYECVKEVTKALRKNFKGIQSNSYGYCCNSDYDTYHDYINNNDYVCAKIYKGGLNNDYYNGKFKLYDSVYFTWYLTNFNLDDVLNVMEDVIKKYNYKLIKPANVSECIQITIKKEV